MRASLESASGSEIKTFGALFQSPLPPMDLLRLSQRFFKRNVARCSKASPEQRIAYLFYLLCIVVARVRRGVKTSRLPDADLLESIKTMMAFAWVEDPIRALLAEARKRIVTGSRE